MQPHKDIRYLKGVGEKRAKLYEKLGITAVSYTHLCDQRSPSWRSTREFGKLYQTA